MRKTIVLFSGGKDSFYSLIRAREMNDIEYLVSIKSPIGDTQLHAGPEADEKLRKTQLSLIGLPHKEIIINSNNLYLHELFVELNKLIIQDKITHIVTGDLWHPYTSGIGDMLAGALGVEIIRPSRDACSSREKGANYMNSVISNRIKSVILSIREGNLSKDYIGREINSALVNELQSQGIDPAAESGEYQSFVLSAPNMRGEIFIDDYTIKLVPGKNGKENFNRMIVKKYHVEN
ncbi:MAG: hypothetical protein WC819_00870 [Parcubacteria group bacterium]|jgi:uncharacterized protein (TIGR00290 family)